MLEGELKEALDGIQAGQDNITEALDEAALKLANFEKYLSQNMSALPLFVVKTYQSSLVDLTAKFQETHGVGPDAVHFGEVEFDESSQQYQGQISVTITDPATGNVIDVVPGDVTGKIRVTRVGPLAATAEILEGNAERGQGLELVLPDEKE